MIFYLATKVQCNNIAQHVSGDNSGFLICIILRIYLFGILIFVSPYWSLLFDGLTRSPRESSSLMESPPKPKDNTNMEKQQIENDRLTNF